MGGEEEAEEKGELMISFSGMRACRQGRYPRLLVRLPACQPVHGASFFGESCSVAASTDTMFGIGAVVSCRRHRAHSYIWKRRLFGGKNRKENHQRPTIPSSFSSSTASFFLVSLEGRNKKRSIDIKCMW
jgi:hypothetical protein